LEVVETLPLKFYSPEHYAQLWERQFYEEARSVIERAKMEIAGEAEPVQVLEHLEVPGILRSVVFVLKRTLPASQQKAQLDAGTLVVLLPSEVLLQLYSPITTQADPTWSALSRGEKW
jgi:hypothetical protein